MEPQKLSQQEYDALRRKQLLNNVIFGSIQYQSTILDLLHGQYADIFNDYRDDIVAVDSSINSLLLSMNKELQNILNFKL